MSEQHAETFEEGVDSAHSRLDAILDQLNSLGTTETSGLPKTPQPIRRAPTLRSVPDLETLIPPALLDLTPVSSTVEYVAPPSAESTAADSEQSAQPSLEAPELEQVDEPLVAEYHELTQPPEPETEYLVPELPAVETADFSGDEPKQNVSGDEELVFMLEGPLDTEQLADTAPETDVSSVTESEFIEPELPQPKFPASDVNEDVDTGWISHHEAHQVVETELVVPTIEDVERPVTEAPSFDAPEQAEEPSGAAADPEAEVASVDVLGHQQPEADEIPGLVDLDFFDVEGASGLNVLEMELDFDGVEETPEHTEPTSEALTLDVLGTDFESEHSASIEDVDATGYEPLFETDEELPLPDFTGVWVDEAAPGSMRSEEDGAQKVGLPEPVEKGGDSRGIAVGRNELDSLRPVDEEPDVADEALVARKLQLVMVVLFGLIALAVIFLNDAAAVDDLREIYDGFFG